MTVTGHDDAVGEVSVPPATRSITAGAGLTGGGDLSADRTLTVGANADGSITVNADDVQVGVLATDAQHGARGGGTQHANATTSTAGFMSSTDKAKLDASGTASGALLFSPLDWFQAGGVSANAQAGNDSVGCRWTQTKSATVTGIRFYWPGATARTVKCSLRDGGGTAVKTVDVSVNGAGYYTGTFASSQTTTVLPSGQTWKAAIWEKSGTEYARYATPPVTIPTLPFVGGSAVIWDSFAAFGAGDSDLTSVATNERYPVEPVFA